jgi:hypothetical protein
MDDLISHYGDIKRNTFFSQLINLRKKVPITKHIQHIHLLDLFMDTLKENIQHEVHLFEPKSLEKAYGMARRVENKNMATRRVTTNNYKENYVPSLKPTRLTPQQIDERRVKGLCFNCDNKYSKGNKCSKKKLFYINCEEKEDQEL